MKFAIRDDDVNFFTKPEDLEKVYNDIWNICPVSFAVIPFVKGMVSPMIPEKYWNEKKYFPIGENFGLVAYLKEKIKEKKISIMLHGYSHENNPDGYEFETGDNLYNKIKDGKEYLEKVFGVEVKTFVPPHNTISKEGVKAINKLGMNLAVVPSFYFDKRPWNYKTFKVFLKRRIFKIKYKDEPPFVFDFGNHKEIRCIPLTPIVNFKFLKEKFDIAYKFNGVFCLATHYWEMNSKMKDEPERTQKEIFLQFLEYIYKLTNIEFVTLDTIFKYGIF